MLKGIGKDEGMQPDLMFKLRTYVNFDDWFNKPYVHVIPTFNWQKRTSLMVHTYLALK